MQHRRLGKSAIYVSDICMGTMTFGSQADEATSHRILDQSLEAGINFFDTAEGYPVPPDAKWVGRTEEFFGRWMKTKDRDAIILATKVSGPSHTWFKSPKRAGMTALDRHNIIKAVEDSLRRLQTDYIDLYQTHWPDHGTAYEETMEVLDELVRAGKVRIVGCSNETLGMGPAPGRLPGLQTGLPIHSGAARYLGFGVLAGLFAAQHSGQPPTDSFRHPLHGRAVTARLLGGPPPRQFGTRGLFGPSPPWQRSGRLLVQKRLLPMVGRTQPGVIANRSVGLLRHTGPRRL